MVQTLYLSILLNLVLAIFNLLPLSPLDGRRVVLSMLPNALAKPFAKLERFGFLVLLGIIFLLPMLGGSLGTDLNVSDGWLRFRLPGSCRFSGQSLEHLRSG